MKYIFVTFFACLSLVTFSQRDFRPGYIITLDADTLYGKIDYRGDYTMGRLCRFMNQDGDIQRYSPSNIAGYRFMDGKYYVSKEVNNRKVFLEFLIQGKANIYYYRDETKDTYYIEKENETLSELVYEEEELSNAATKYNRKYIGVLNYYMQDAPEIQPKIAKIKYPDHKALINVAQDYHYMVCEEGEECVIYQKKVQPVKLDLEVFGGLYYFLGSYRDNGWQVGALANIWFPALNEKFYIRTGIINNGLISTEDERKHTWKFPFQLEYQYANGFFRPKFSGGLSFYSWGHIAPSYMVGFNVRLSDLLFITAHYEIEFEPNEYFFIFPSGDIIGNSFNLGVYFKF